MKTVRKRGRPPSHPTVTAMKDARQCPKCGRISAYVQDSRVDKRGFLKRRRVCPWCGCAWNTAEVDYEDALELFADKEEKE